MSSISSTFMQYAGGSGPEIDRVELKGKPLGFASMNAMEIVYSYIVAIAAKTSVFSPGGDGRGTGRWQ